MRLQKGIAQKRVFSFPVNINTLTVQISKDGGNLVPLAGTVTKVSSRIFSLALTAGDVDTLGCLAYQFNTPIMGPVTPSGETVDQVGCLAVQLADCVHGGPAARFELGGGDATTPSFYVHNEAQGGIAATFISQHEGSFYRVSLGDANYNEALTLESRLATGEWSLVGGAWTYANDAAEGFYFWAQVGQCTSELDISLASPLDGGAVGFSLKTKDKDGNTPRGFAICDNEGMGMDGLPCPRSVIHVFGEIIVDGATTLTGPITATNPANNITLGP